MGGQGATHGIDRRVANRHTWLKSIVLMFGTSQGVPSGTRGSVRF